MKRREFLRKSAIAAAAAPILINGLPMRALSQKSYLSSALNGAFDDRILVLIQLRGGNDGLNTLIPISQYGTYSSYRPDIAIADSGARKYIDLDSGLASADQIGLHPDMMNMKSLYENGMVNIVQGVGYENTNGSHFRSRDIWFQGGDYDEYKNSGWMGRYLDHEFPNYPEDYPNAEMPDPLGLEIGSRVSLGFHREEGIPAAIAVEDPSDIADVVGFLGGVAPNNTGTDHYSQELQNIMDIYSNTSDFASNLQNTFNAGNNNVAYPGGTLLEYPFACPANFKQNTLGPQLATVARLIQGGSKTKIYMVSFSGFDTHDSQVSNTESSYGGHSALLYHLSNAVKAFFDDLAVSGMDEKVMGMTFTDFGRRPVANGSYGTDHGTSSPTFVFGKNVQAGVTGTNPSLTDLDANNNLLIQHDYRQVITSVLCDWLGADMSALVATEMDSFADQKINIVDMGSSVSDLEMTGSFAVNIFPNPVATRMEVAIKSASSSNLIIQFVDAEGSVVREEKEAILEGNNQLRFDAQELPTGNYTLFIRKSETGEAIGKKFLKV